jgi:hypothetical protein
MGDVGDDKIVGVTEGSEAMRGAEAGDSFNGADEAEAQADADEVDIEQIERVYR